MRRAVDVASSPRRPRRARPRCAPASTIGVPSVRPSNTPDRISARSASWRGVVEPALARPAPIELDLDLARRRAAAARRAAVDHHADRAAVRLAPGVDPEDLAEASSSRRDSRRKRSAQRGEAERSGVARLSRAGNPDVPTGAACGPGPCAGARRWRRCRRRSWARLSRPERSTAPGPRTSQRGRLGFSTASPFGRTIAAPVHDAHAAQASRVRFDQELLDQRARGRRVAAVEVEVGLRRELAPAHAAQHARIEAGYAAFLRFVRLEVVERSLAADQRIELRASPRAPGRRTSRAHGSASAAARGCARAVGRRPSPRGSPRRRRCRPSRLHPPRVMSVDGKPPGPSSSAARAAARRARRREHSRASARARGSSRPPRSSSRTSSSKRSMWLNKWRTSPTVSPGSTRSPVRSRTSAASAEAGWSETLGISQSPPSSPRDGRRSKSTRPRRTSTPPNAWTARGLAFRAGAGNASGCPVARAAHTPSTGQSGQAGLRGVQTVAPSSISAWLNWSGSRAGTQLPREPPRIGVGQARDGAQPREHAAHVAVDDRRGLLEGDAAERAHRVAPDSRQLPEGVRLARQRAAVIAHDDLRGAVQVPRACVVAEPRPEPEHVLLIRGRQRLQVGKPRQEALVVRYDGLDTRLLQHRLGEPDAVGVGAAPPRQVAPRAPVPVEQASPNGVAPGARKRCAHDASQFVAGVVSSFPSMCSAIHFGSNHSSGSTKPPPSSIAKCR